MITKKVSLFCNSDMDALIRFTLRKNQHVSSANKSEGVYGSIITTLNIIIANLDKCF